MARIQFKGKVETIYNVDDTIAYKRIKVPNLDRKHCDMNAFRYHEKYGSYANSDLFKQILGRIKDSFFKSGWIKIDNIPDNVIVDTTGFLAVVIIDV